MQFLSVEKKQVVKISMLHTCMKYFEGKPPEKHINKMLMFNTCDISMVFRASYTCIQMIVA